MGLKSATSTKSFQQSYANCMDNDDKRERKKELLVVCELIKIDVSVIFKLPTR